MKIKRPSRKALSMSGILILALFFCVAIILSWSPSAGDRLQAARKAGDGRSGTDSAVVKSSGKKIKPGSEDSGHSIDPRLEKVTLSEILPEEEVEELTPEEKDHKRILNIMTLSIKEINRILPSFVYEGEMRMKIPTFNRDEESYRAGKRFGKSEDVVSRFTYTRDEEGNYSLAQTTQTTTENERFKAQQLNGELYYVDGTYTFVDHTGQRSEGDSLETIVTATEKSGGEPLVRNHWIQLLRNVDAVIDFEKKVSTEEADHYDIQEANPDLQKKTTEINSLSGSLSVDGASGLMTGAAIDGTATLRDGYMSGADIGFSINLRIHDVGMVKQIDTP